MSYELFNELATWAVIVARRWCVNNNVHTSLRSDCVQEALIDSEDCKWNSK